ncbi:MAG: hypothetical protein O2960_20090 [Verrucomicrobia bacterium]|nr:hypothetical protein [Verrucomicrobiota bacterium]
MEAKAHYLAEDRIRFIRSLAFDVLDETPMQLDMVLFDGGDDETDEEFDLIFPRIQKFVALDDTNERKNIRQMTLLLMSPHWKIIRGSETQRNGWAVFKKKT